MKNAAYEQSDRLTTRIIELGGKIPQPWPWAVNKRRKRNGRIITEVDGALWNLQLLELVEDLEKEKGTK